MLNDPNTLPLDAIDQAQGLAVAGNDVYTIGAQNTKNQQILGPPFNALYFAVGASGSNVIYGINYGTNYASYSAYVVNGVEHRLTSGDKNSNSSKGYAMTVINTQ